MNSKKAIDLEPLSAAAHNKRGRLASAPGRGTLTPPSTRWKRPSRCNPTWPKPITTSGFCCCKKADQQRAEVEFQKAQGDLG